MVRVGRGGRGGRHGPLFVEIGEVGKISKAARCDELVVPNFHRPSLFGGVSVGGDGTGAESWMRATRRASRRSIRRGCNFG